MKVKQQGFTLIELVVVIVILGILAAIATPRYIDLTGRANTAVLEGGAGALSSAALLEYADNNPPSANSLSSIVDSMEGTDIYYTTDGGGDCTASRLIGASSGGTLSCAGGGATVYVCNSQTGTSATSVAISSTFCSG